MLEDKHGIVFELGFGIDTTPLARDKGPLGSSGWRGPGSYRRLDNWICVHGIGTALLLLYQKDTHPGLKLSHIVVLGERIFSLVSPSPELVLVVPAVSDVIFFWIRLLCFAMKHA